LMSHCGKQWSRAVLLLQLLVGVVQGLPGGNGDVRLLDPGSPLESHANLYEQQKRKAQSAERAIDAELKHTENMSKKMSLHPHQEEYKLKESAAALSTLLSSAVRRDQQIASAAESALKAFDSVARMFPGDDADDEDLGESNSIADADDDDNGSDLGESSVVSGSHSGKVWSYGQARWVKKGTISAQEAAAREDYKKLQAHAHDDLKPKNIERAAHELVMETMPSLQESAALSAERADERAMQTAKRKEQNVQASNQLKIQQQRLEAAQDQVLSQHTALKKGIVKIGGVLSRAKINLKTGEAIDRISRRLTLYSTSSDLGQSLDSGSGDMAGQQMEAKKARLQQATEKLQKKTRSLAIRDTWKKGSGLEVYSLEMQRWYPSTVLKRHGHSLHVQNNKIGLDSWMPDTSKHIRPSHALMAGDLGQSDSDSTQARLKNVLSQTQLQSLSPGIKHEQHDRRLIIEFAKTIKRDATKLGETIGEHISATTNKRLAPPDGHPSAPAEQFIDPALAKVQLALQQEQAFGAQVSNAAIRLSAATRNLHGLQIDYVKLSKHLQETGRVIA